MTGVRTFFRKLPLFLVLLLTVLSLAWMFGVLFIYIVGYMIGGLDLIEQLMAPGQVTEHDELILFGMILMSITGGIIGIHVWRALMKFFGLVELI
jgi:hypothetical protein